MLVDYHKLLLYKIRFRKWFVLELERRIKDFTLERRIKEFTFERRKKGIHIRKEKKGIHIRKENKGIHIRKENKGIHKSHKRTQKFKLEKNDKCAKSYERYNRNKKKKTEEKGI